MHKGTKIAIIIAAVLLVVGCVMAGIGYTVIGGNITVDYEQKDKYEKRFSDEVNKIEVELRSERVELYVISGDEYVVEYYDNARKYLDVELDGDILRVARNNVRVKWYENIHIGFEEPIVDVRIGVPTEFYGEVELNAGSGGISVEGLTLEKPLQVSVGSGGIGINNVYCSELTASTGSGGMKIDGVTVIKDASITAGSGGIRIEELRCGEKFKAEAGSGAIRLEDCSADTVRLKTASGSINFEDFSYDSSAYISAGSGGVRGELTGRERDYSIRSDTDSGSCNLPERTDNGKKILDVSTGSGSIKIEFADD